MQSILFEDREVGKECPAFIIAEAGINHNGRLDTALELIDAAAEAGCDAVKFQKRSVHALLSREAYEKPYDNRGHSYGATYGQHRERLELSHDDYRRLHHYARTRGITFMASPWDPESAEFVDELGVVAHKIGSPDLTNLDLCRQIAGYGKPVILSTGMADRWEVDAAVEVIGEINPQLILLHCVSIYPTPPEEIRLGNIRTLAERYGVPVGYSGHELGWHVVGAALALGACVIEKHITLDRTMTGGDHGFSLEPDELARMVQHVRETQAALSRSDKPLLDAERPFREKLAKSVTTRVPISKGTRITEDMLVYKCPATGVSPTRVLDLVGQTVSRDLEADTVVRTSDLSMPWGPGGGS